MPVDPRATAPRTVLVLYGPKAVGKSWVAQVAAQRLGVHHVDADRLVLQLLAVGEEPDPAQGWLAPVHRAVLHALQEHETVSVEATGAWDSDWRLAERLTTDRVRVLRVLVWATKELSLHRLAARGPGRVPVTTAHAVEIHDAVTARAQAVRWDARIDTSGDQDADAVVAVLGPLLP